MMPGTEMAFRLGQRASLTRLDSIDSIGYHPEQTRTEPNCLEPSLVRTRTEHGVCSVRRFSNKPNKPEPALFGEPTLSINTTMLPRSQDREQNFIITGL